MDNRYRVKVTKIVEEAKDVKTYSFKVIKGDFPKFLPGQFIFMFIPINGEEVKRAYSLSSSPLDDQLELTIELTPGGKMTTHCFECLNVGDEVEFGDPQGNFSYTDQKDIVMIAAGSGIAPMRSIIRFNNQKKNGTKVLVLYSSKKQDQIIYREELQKLSKENPNITIIHTLTREQPENWEGELGRINTEKIQKYVDNPTEKTYFICGSNQFNLEQGNMLKALGVSMKQIKRDFWG